MRHRALVASILVLALGLMVGPSFLDARQATPAAGGAVGVTAELLGTGQPAAAPGHDLALRRITIEPGGSLAAHTHPGALVIVVEAGAFAYTALGGSGEIHRAATGGTPGPTETVPIGTEVILNPGDWLFVEDPADAVRNGGDDPVVLLVAGLTRTGEPFTTFTEGTPLATPTT